MNRINTWYVNRKEHMVCFKMNEHLIMPRFIQNVNKTRSFIYNAYCQYPFVNVIPFHFVSFFCREVSFVIDLAIGFLKKIGFRIIIITIQTAIIMHDCCFASLNTFVDTYFYPFILKIVRKWSRHGKKYHLSLRYQYDHRCDRKSFIK